MKKILRVLMMVLAAVLLCLVAYRTIQMRGRSGTTGNAVGDYGTVSNFSFMDQEGRPFGRDHLKGHPWIANFIFTRCMGPCPLITTRMAELQNEFAGHGTVRFVSFSVDPGYDTPERLKKYASNYGAKEGRWFFLTGDRARLYEFIRTSFRLGVDENKGAKPGEEFIHSLSFVLVDKDARIRGYYNSVDAEALAKLRKDLKAL